MNIIKTNFLSQQYLHRATFFLFVLWIFITFASLDSLPFISDYYNVWRMNQIFLLIICSLIFLIQPISKLIQIPKAFICVISAISICYFMSYFMGVKNTTAYLTISLNLLILISLIYFANTFSSDFTWHEKILAICILLPIPAIIYFFTGVIIQLFDPTYQDHGHNHFNNIRYFNDALLPILILLWMRPGFLAQAKYNKAIIVLSTLYLYVFLSDGARAIILAFGLAILMILLFDRKRIKNIKIPLLSLILSASFFYAMQYLIIFIHGEDIYNLSLTRATSSGRLDLYLYSLESFIRNPIQGMGIANFTLPIDDPKFHGQGHPHNIFLLLLSEMGILGFIISALLTGSLIFLFCIRKRVATWGWIGIYMITINGMLSGALTYPFSQMLSLLLIIYVYAQYQQDHPAAVKPNTLSNLLIFYNKALIIIATPILILTTYWILPYLQEMPLNQQDLILDDTLIYRAKGPSTWQQNPIMNFPQKNEAQ